jgi:hypothetical protein
MYPPRQAERWGTAAKVVPDLALRTALRVSGPVEGFGVREHAAQTGLISAQDADLEVRLPFRSRQTPVAATLLVRGGPDTADKFRRHAERTARAWALDGQPLLGISVFAVLDISLDDLLRRRFTSFRTIYVPAAGQLAEYRFELLPTGQRPHFTVRLRDADAPELDRLLKALGAAQPNPQYAGGMIWREEG